MKTYRIFAQYENGIEKEFFSETSKQAKTDMSLFLSTDKKYLCKAMLTKWDSEMEEYLEVNCSLSFCNF